MPKKAKKGYHYVFEIKDCMVISKTNMYMFPEMGEDGFMYLKKIYSNRLKKDYKKPRTPRKKKKKEFQGWNQTTKKLEISFQRLNNK